MAQIDMLVALWNRDTEKRQMASNDERYAGLVAALAACEMQLSKILKPLQTVLGVFVAPEYYFAAPKSGIGNADGSFNLRCVTEGEKDTIVRNLLVLSKKYPKLLLIPGTIAWWKSLNRTPEGDFKRDSGTNERTTVRKTQTRMASLDDAFQKNINAGGVQGGRLPTELLYTKVRQKLIKATPKGTVSPKDVEKEVYRLLNDDAALVLEFGKLEGLCRGVPTQSESLAQLHAGKVDKVMKNTAYVLLNSKIRFKYNKQNDFHEALSDDGKLIFCPGSKAGFVSIDGIDVGLEICLDHAAGQLARTPLPVTGEPNLHIITSASVQIENSIVRPNGYLVHASAQPALAMVQQWNGNSWVPAKPIEEKNLGGDPLQFYKIQVTVP